MSAQPVIFPSAEEGTRLPVIADSIRVLATTAQTDDKFEVFEITGPRDSGPPPHAHPWSEAYLIVSGSVEILVDGESVDCAPGGFVHVPPGTVHATRVTSESATFYLVTGPGKASNLFAELVGQTEIPAIVDIALRNGLTVATAPAAS